MESIQKSPLADKVILIHRGALGDALCAWPSAWAVSRALPGVRLVFAGEASRSRWFAPLGFETCPPELRRALDGLFGASSWPEAISGWKILWFVVDRVPDVPSWPGLSFLRAVEEPEGERPERVLPGHPGTAGQTSRPRGRMRPDHVREALAAGLSRLGVETPPGWLEDFRRLFAAGRRPGREVLLFPGAGHPLKQWPLVQYFRLADRLNGLGYFPRFVLGPAELERGLDLAGRAWTAPEGIEELEQLLLSSRAVVGGDTGPMHLAGMLGVPGVSLFGPTSFAQWGPVGLLEASLGLPCSPCTATCRDLACYEPRCLDGITPEHVLELLRRAAL